MHGFDALCTGKVGEQQNFVHLKKVSAGKNVCLAKVGAVFFDLGGLGCPTDSIWMQGKSTMSAWSLGRQLRSSQN